MSQCPAITRNGGACKGWVRPGDVYCVAHDPARAEQRSAAASKAGRSKPSAEIRTLKNKLIRLGDDVLAHKVNRADASVATQAYGAAIKACEAEVKLREYEEVTLPEFTEIVRRVEEIESLQAMGGNGWGA